MLSTEYTEKEMLRHLVVTRGADISLEQNYPFTTAANYSYGVLLEIVSGKIKLVGAPYSQLSPAVTFVTTLQIDSLEKFTETSTKTGSDEIKYILQKDGIDYYYSSGWVVSDGTYSQSNTAAEIETNKSTFTSTDIELTIKALLFSFDGSTTPELDNVYIEYNVNKSSTLLIALEQVKFEMLWEYFSEEYEQGEIQVISTASTSRDNFLSSLDDSQRYMFFAEVFYACSVYLRMLDMEDLQSGSSSITGSSFSIEGYSTSDSSGDDSVNVSALMRSAIRFNNKAKYMMLKAGYDIANSISRTRPRGY